MSSIIVEPTSTAGWYSLIQEAEKSCHIQLNIELENYIILLLQRFTNEIEFTHKVLGLEYLKSLHEIGTQKQLSLRDVGDQCLLITGLFPGRAERRRVRVSYFIDVGQNAYSELANHTSRDLNQLFSNLCCQFVTLMDVLQATRELKDKTASLTPLQAEEIWQDTQSPHALNILKQYTNATPSYSKLNKIDKKH